MAIKHVLVPIDCSAATKRVLAMARELAGALGAELHLVHVQEISVTPPVVPLGYGAIGMPEMVPMSSGAGAGSPIVPDEQQQNKLAAWKSELAAAGIKVSVHQPIGDVTEEILKRAQEVKPDVIVMGRHGHGAMYNLLVGSVTEGVLKRANCPVMLVPSDAPTSAEKRP